MKYDNRAIGVFDSGVGGLTVVKQIIKRLPGENIIYFGDTARIPYGTKSEEIVRRFALEDSFFLLDKDVKMIVVACNTASAIAIPMLQEILEVPVIGVIQPGALAAVTISKKKRIGVIGTAATIRSNSYQKEINNISPDSQVIQQACPLFVPMVEEGWTEDDITSLIVKRYLHILKENEVDSVILGCTHYPLLKTAIEKTMGPSVSLVDSGIETAGAVEKNLNENNMFADSTGLSKYHFYLSDMPYKFQEIAERFLERTIPHVETINFDNFLIEKGGKFWKKYQDLLKRVY